MLFPAQLDNILCNSSVDSMSLIPLAWLLADRSISLAGNLEKESVFIIGCHQVRVGQLNKAVSIGCVMVTENHDSSGPGSIPSDLLDIRGDYLDREQLMTRVADRVNQRRAEAGFIPQRFPSYDGVPYPNPPEDAKYDPDLYHHLRLANKSYLEVKTEPELLPSPVTRIPIIGQLWSSVRGHAHSLVLFYVNRAVRHEVSVNRYIISVLNSFALAYQDQQKCISDLESEIEELGNQLDQ